MTHKNSLKRAITEWLQLLPKKVVTSTTKKDFLTNQMDQISRKQFDLFVRFFSLCNKSKNVLQHGLAMLSGVSLLAHPLQNVLLTFKSIIL